MKEIDELCERIIGVANDFMSNMALNRDKGNKAAAARARKYSVALEKLLKDYRKMTISASK